MPQAQVLGAYPTVKCSDRVKAGFFLGFVVGTAIGGVMGAFAAKRTGLRGKEFAQNVFKSLFKVGGSFGTFMAIGTAIRC